MAEEPIKLFASRAERYPQPDESDAMQSAARAALASIPVLGGPIVELLPLIVTPAIARRRDEWVKELADSLEKLESKVEGFKVKNLVNDDAFVSAVIQTTRSAMATHQLEKRAMLRNTLLNTALGKGPNEELRDVFLATIDGFSPYHLKVLKFIWTGVADLNEAGKWNTLHPYRLTNYVTAIGELHPDLKAQESLLLYIMTDLKSKGFTTVSRPHDSFPQSPGITNMGIEFLQFVLKSPV